MAFEVPSPESLPVVSAPPAGMAGSALLLVVSVAFAVGGQLILKTAMDRVGRIGAGELSGGASQVVGRAAREPRLWLGLVLFGVSALFWLIVLSRVPLSVAYPFVGISYVLVVAFARFALGEHVPALRWIGVAVVACGIVIVGLSFRRAAI